MGGLWGGAVSCDGMVGCAGPANLVGKACLMIVSMQGLEGSLVVGGAGYVVGLGVETLQHSDGSLQGGGSRLH